MVLAWTPKCASVVGFVGVWAQSSVSETDTVIIKILSPPHILQDDFSHRSGTSKETLSSPYIFRDDFSFREKTTSEQKRWVLSSIRRKGSF